MSRLTATRISRSQVSQSRTRRTGGKRQKRQADSPDIHPLLQMQQTHGNRAVGRMIQAQLKVSQPGDQYEQEADRIAEQVVNDQNSMTSRPAAISSNSQGPSMQRMPEMEDDKNELKKPDEMAVSTISRMPEGEEEQELSKKPAEGESEEDMPPALQTKPAAHASPSVKPSVASAINRRGTRPVFRKEAPSVASAINRMQGGGQHLPNPVRAYFEPRMGADFSQVRVHSDSHAADTAKSINARAFTVGGNIAFGAGEYSPGTASGRKLLAHELTHVLQQSEGRSNTRGLEISQANRSVQCDLLDDITEELTDAGESLAAGAESTVSTVIGEVGSFVESSVDAAISAVSTGTQTVSAAVESAQQTLGPVLESVPPVEQPEEAQEFKIDWNSPPALILKSWALQLDPQIFQEARVKSPAVLFSQLEFPTHILQAVEELAKQSRSGVAAAPVSSPSPISGPVSGP